MLTNFSDRKRD